MEYGLKFLGFDAEYSEATHIVFGAPFDGTTSFRPGTRFAGAFIRQESNGLETYSPYLEREITDYQICDMGDLELPFGNTQRVLDMIYKNTKQIVNDSKVPFLIGGEHLVSYGSIKAVYEKYPELNIVHFDAHTDLREHYMEEEFSHATVIRRAWDLVGDGKIYQFGIRSGEKAEFEWAKEHTYLNKFNTKTLDKIVESLGDKPVYITIDLDILDPSVFPGTGTPEPGGIFFGEMMEAIKIMSNLNVVGADVVELSPHYDNSGISTAAACKVIRELILAIQK